MIRHIAMFHLTKEADAYGREKLIDEMKLSVDNMNGKIPGLILAQLGVNISGGPYDIVMYCEFEDAGACEAFGEHPLHAAHREKMKQFVEDRVWADYNVD